MAAAPKPVQSFPCRLAWSGAAAVAIAFACAVPLARFAWVVALAAELSAQAACLTAVVALAALVRRRWRTAAVLAACLALHLVYLWQPRAARAPGPAQATLLIVNAHTGSSAVSPMLGRLLGADADVLVLVEPDAELVRVISRDRPLEASHPHLLMRGPTPGVTSWRIVLSRWPLEDRRTEEELICVVNAPFGRFGLVALHPASPRDAQRWRRGNQIARDAGAAAASLSTDGLPVIIAGDLNSTPAGWRDRLLRGRAGVGRCKPRTVLAGTFPAVLPGALRLAVDDAWVSPDWAVCFWRTGPAAGSDHASVEIGLRLSE